MILSPDNNKNKLSYLHSLYKKGIECHNKKDHTGALKYYTLIISIKNKNEHHMLLSTSYYNRGNIYYKLNDKNKAIRDFTLANKLLKKHTKKYKLHVFAIFKRALLYKDINKVSKAISDLSYIYKCG